MTKSKRKEQKTAKRKQKSEDRIQKSPGRTQHQPKADIIVSIVGMVPVADRTADVAGLIVPRTAARVAPARR